MKLLLTSNGFSTPEIIAKCEALVGKSKEEISTIVINEAYAMEHEDHRWLINDLIRLSQNFGGKIEFLNLLATDTETVRERIETCDVIFVIGGDTDYLQSVFNKTGFSELLPEVLRTKVYVGISAGAMVAGKRLDVPAFESMYAGQDTYGVSKYLEFGDFVIIPHMNSEHFPGREEKLLEACKQHSGTIYALSDQDAVVLNDGKVELVGGNIVTIKDGKVV